MNQRLFNSAMSVFHQLLRRASGLFALGLALALVMGSLCPRGWFICVQPGQVELVDVQHADGADACGDSDCCADGIDVGDGCLDFAVSLVFDDQLAVPTLALTHLTGGVKVALPGLLDSSERIVAHVGAMRKQIHSPPGTACLKHISLLV
jgi:hypothetical protein